MFPSLKIINPKHSNLLTIVIVFGVYGFLHVNLRAKTHCDLRLILMQPVVLQVFKTHSKKLMLAFSKNSPLTDRPHGIQKPFRNLILKDKSSEIDIS